MALYQSAIYSKSKSASSDTEISLTLVQTESGVDLECHSDEKLLDLNSQLLAPEIRSLRFNRNSKEHFESKLIYIFDKYFDQYVLKCSLNGDIYIVDWDPDEKVEANLQFTWSKEKMITDLLVNPDQDPDQTYHVIGDKFCLNKKEKILSRCDIKTALGVAHSELKPYYTHDEFNKMGLVYSESIRGCFSDNLVPCDGNNTKKQVYIEESEASSSSHILSFREQTHGQIFDGTKPIFEALASIQYLYEPLNKEGRKNQLKRAVLMLLNAESREDRDNVIAQMIKEPLFTTVTMKQVAKRFLIEVFDKVVSKKTTQVISTVDGLKLLECSSAVSGQGLSIPALLFDIKLDSIFSTPSIELSSALLSQNLPILLGLYNKNNIELFWNNKPVSVTSVDITIKPKMEEANNWFDLHPDVKVDGKVIQETLDKIKDTPFIETDTEVKVFAENSMNTIDYLMSWWKQYEDQQNNKNQSNIVQIKRLRMLELLVLRSKGINIKLSNSDMALLDQLSNLEKVPNYDVQSKFKGKLWDFQQTGYNWLCFLYEYGFGACLADDMGLGKTIQTISFLMAMHHNLIDHPNKTEQKRSLIVVPPSLIYNWMSEFEKFSEGLTISAYMGTERESTCLESDIVITSYDIVRRDLDLLNEVGFHCLICDEAQQIKNMNTKRTKAIRQLNAEFRLTLTGTPIENHLSDFYSIMDLSVPGLLGSYKEFNAKVKEGQNRFFLDKTKPFVLRRKKETVLKSLPPKIESDIYLELTPEQRVFYTQMVAQVRKDVSIAFKNRPSQQAGIMALTALLRLRQICVSPALIDPNYNHDSPKINFLMSKLQELNDEGHSALVFSQFTKTLDLLESTLKDVGLNVLRMDGKTSAIKRQKIVQTFQESNKPYILIMSLKVGGVGLNLTQASYVFHMDPWWNPAVENQATDRVHRIGQTQKVLVTRLMMKHTVEEKMMALKEKKLSLYKAVLEDHKQQASSGLSWEDFESLLP